MEGVCQYNKPVCQLYAAEVTDATHFCSLIIFSSSRIVKALLFLLLFLSYTTFGQNTPSPIPFGAKKDGKLTVTVHPGVELLSIIQYLAGHAGPRPSPYLTDVRQHFAPFRNHPAVLFLFNSDARFGYDLPELGWCFDNPLKPSGFIIPDSTYWLKSFSRPALTDYLTLCLDFARQSHFAAFYQQHQADYNRWSQAFTRQVDSLQVIQKLEAFYRHPTTSRWYICLDPLNAYGAHAIMTRTLAPAYSNYIVYQQGYWNRNTKPDIDPTFDVDMYNLVWHEGSHIYINQLLNQYRTRIDSLSYLMRESVVLHRQNIDDWQHFVDESVVRAISVAMYRKYLSPELAKQQLEREQKSGFVYTDQLAHFILDDYLNTSQYSSFENYFPVLLKQWSGMKL